MAFTVDYSTTRGETRLLIPDVDSATALFDDEQIDAFLTLEGSNPFAAAALAVDTIARNEALLLKVVAVRGQASVSTDGAKLAAELRQHAKALRDRAAEWDTAQDTSLGFDIAEMVTSAPLAARRVIDSTLETG